LVVTKVGVMESKLVALLVAMKAMTKADMKVELKD
jgi:hypothetical protein